MTIAIEKIEDGGDFSPEHDLRMERLRLTADIAGRVIDRNSVATDGVPGLIASVHAALVACDAATFVDAAPKHEPFRPVRGSVTADAIFSLIDGKPYKMLRRHLHTHGLTPEAYRERYGLPADYPMVAATYAETRRGLAMAIGLGRNGGGRPKAK